MMKPHLLFAAIVAAAPAFLVLVPALARAEAVRLSDGDSFRLGDHRYRLHGIDAPELHQDCKDAKGNSWPCGTRARSELRRLIGTHPVECRAVTVDRFGRIVATCSAGGKDLAEEMVRSGYATIFTRSGIASPYEKAQAEARAEKRGIWAGSFDVPSDWRRANPRDEEPGGGAHARDWVAQLAVQAWNWLQQKLGL
jgi:endonuclease YncB( thermonuclease family)